MTRALAEESSIRLYGTTHHHRIFDPAAHLYCMLFNKCCQLLVSLATFPCFHCFQHLLCGFHVKTALASMKASINIAVSVDGMIAEKDGGIDWLNNQPSIEGEDMGFQAFLDSVDVMIMGRNTFEKVLSFGKEAWAYGELPVVVMSRSHVDIPDHLAKTVSSSSLNPKALVDKLASEGCKHAYVDGGYTIRQFIKDGLIQDMTLTTVPILLGDGIRLFSDQGPLKLKLINSKAWPNGMVQNKYEVL